MPDVMRNKLFYCCFVSSFSLQIAVGAEQVSWKNLARLPAGTAITLQGSTKDVPASQLAGFKVDRDKDFLRSTLADLIQASSLKLTYKVAGLEAREVSGSVSGEQWTAVMDPLPENGSVTLTLEFDGTLGAELAKLALGKVAGSQAFADGRQSAIDQALKIQRTTEDKAEQRQAIEKAIDGFVRKILPDLVSALPEFVKGVQVSDAPAQMAGVIDSLSALPTSWKALEMVEEFKAVPEANRTSYMRVAEALAPSEDPRARYFLATWNNTVVALQRAISAKLTSSMSVVASSGVKDFEKYAAVDLGTAWIPGIEELRTFVTLNVYLGPVEERPYYGAGWWERLRQTFSLTAGYSFSDISGRNEQKSSFRDNNAFLLGVGVRLNKYFRLIGGTALYRYERWTAPDPAVDPVGAYLQGRLRTARFFGGSIDVTALPNLRALFGKAGSTPAPPVTAPAPSPKLVETAQPK